MTRSLSPSCEWKLFLNGRVPVTQFAVGLNQSRLLLESLPCCLVQHYQSLDFHELHYVWDSPFPIEILARVCLPPWHGGVFPPIDSIFSSFTHVESENPLPLTSTKCCVSMAL